LERVGHVKVLEARVVRPPGFEPKWVRNHKLKKRLLFPTGIIIRKGKGVQARGILDIGSAFET